MVAYPPLERIVKSRNVSLRDLHALGRTQLDVKQWAGLAIDRLVMVGACGVIVGAVITSPAVQANLHSGGGFNPDGDISECGAAAEVGQAFCGEVVEALFVGGQFGPPLSEGDNDTLLGVIGHDQLADD